MPHSVLVFPFLSQRLLWVKHPSRGWEVPGGKVEPGESPDDAARREVFEEAGVTLVTMSWLSEYAIPSEQGKLYKWVYVGYVEDVHARPTNSETMDVQVMWPEITPETVCLRADVSPVMKDDVYPTVWPVIQRHWVNHFTE